MQICTSDQTIPAIKVRKFASVKLFSSPKLAAVESYFSKLLPLLAPLQHSKGGPIIAFQGLKIKFKGLNYYSSIVENEYGDYVDKDNEHLPWLADLMKSHGLFELFFISDGGHTIRKANMLKAWNF